MSAARAGCIGCLAVAGIGIVVVCFAGLIYLGSVRPVVPEQDPHLGVTTEAGAEEYERNPGALNEFSREDVGWAYGLQYGFVDYAGEKQRVNFNVAKLVHEQEVAGFGYFEDEMRAEVDRLLQNHVDAEIEARKIGEYIKVRFHSGGGYRWESWIPHTLDAGEYVRAKQEVDQLVQDLKKRYPSIREQLEKPLYRARGFILRGRDLTIDHVGLAIRAEPGLRGCFDALYRISANYSERQRIGLYLAFLQEIRYVLPPDQENGREIMGLWTPTEVLVNNHGDCDSKSVAYASFCKSLGVSCVFLDLPKHVLVGVEGRPGPGQKHVRLGNRYYILCEPAGPGKLHPGHPQSTDVEGSFEYAMLDPGDTEPGMPVAAGAE